MKNKLILLLAVFALTLAPRFGQTQELSLDSKDLIQKAIELLCCESVTPAERDKKLKDIFSAIKSELTEIAQEYRDTLSFDQFYLQHVIPASDNFAKLKEEMDVRFDGSRWTNGGRAVPLMTRFTLRNHPTELESFVNMAETVMIVGWTAKMYYSPGSALLNTSAYIQTMEFLEKEAMPYFSFPKALVELILEEPISGKK